MVKWAYVQLRERAAHLERLSFYAIAERTVEKSISSHPTRSKPEDTNVVMTVDEIDVEKQRRAWDCCVRYAETIERSNLMSTTHLELAPQTIKRIV